MSLFHPLGFNVKLTLNLQAECLSVEVPADGDKVPDNLVHPVFKLDSFSKKLEDFEDRASTQN